MIGPYVGALLVVTVRFGQSRERKLLPAMALFALLAAAQISSLPPSVMPWLHFAAGVAGLWLALAIAPYPPSRAH